MRRSLFLGILFITLSLSPDFASGQEREAAKAWTVYFSPNGGVTDAVVKAIGASKQSVYVLAYSFTSTPIGQALVDAHKRGVKVTVVLDKSHATTTSSSGRVEAAGHPIADMLRQARVPTFIDAAHAIMHNKVMVIDGRTVVTGSLNLTFAGEKKNAENCLIIKDADLAEAYMTNWRTHSSHSTALGKKGSPTDSEAAVAPFDAESQSGRAFCGVKDEQGFRMLRLQAPR